MPVGHCSRLGPGGADGGASGPTTPLASPPRTVAVLGAPAVAGSPSRASGATRLRQGFSPEKQRRRSMDAPPQPQPPTGSPSRSLSGGLSLALRSSPGPSPEKVPKPGYKTMHPCVHVKVLGS